MNDVIQKLKDAYNGVLPSYGWPGGYPMFYFDKDNSVLCPPCANKNNEELFPLVGYDINWQGELWCDECSVQIESAYREDG